MSPEEMENLASRLRETAHACEVHAKAMKAEAATLDKAAAKSRLLHRLRHQQERDAARRSL